MWDKFLGFLSAVFGKMNGNQTIYALSATAIAATPFAALGVAWLNSKSGTPIPSEAVDEQPKQSKEQPKQAEEHPSKTSNTAQTAE